MKTDHELAARVAQGLAVIGMPSPTSTCDVAVIPQGEDLVAIVAFLSLRRKAYEGPAQLTPYASVTFEGGTRAIRADVRNWAQNIVPKEALSRMREECRRSGHLWPHGWPMVTRAALIGA